MKKLAFCGNDCSVCPRYTATQSGDISRLKAVAKLWYQLKLRDTIVSPEEIKCNGCSSSSFCRYGIHKCAFEKKVENCGDCKDYPCDLTVRSFEQTQKYAESISGKCTEEEYQSFEMAFFSKKKNLDKAKKK